MNRRRDSVLHYVGDEKPHAKKCKNRPNRGHSAMKMVNSDKCWRCRWRWGLIRIGHERGGISS